MERHNVKIIPKSASLLIELEKAEQSQPWSLSSIRIQIITKLKMYCLTVYALNISEDILKPSCLPRISMTLSSSKWICQILDGRKKKKTTYERRDKTLLIGLNILWVLFISYFPHWDKAHSEAAARRRLIMQWDVFFPKTVWIWFTGAYKSLSYQ